MRTYTARPQDIEQKWYLIDATDQILGRLAAKAAVLLRGKHKPIYTPSMDTGDFVIIINADKVRVTGKKSEHMDYRRFTGYPDGLKIESFKSAKNRKPEFVVEHAVRGMIPHNRLGRALITKLHVYAGNEHPHKAQKPEVITV